MKKIFKVILCLLSAVIIIGCSYKMHPYSPSILIEGKGRLGVGQFKYLPYDQGKLKDNQVNSDIIYRPIYADQKIVDHVKDATSKELLLIGYKVDPEAQTIISGDIIEYSCKMLGFSYDVLVKIRFVISENKDGTWKETYNNISNGPFSISKFETSNISAILNEGLKNCINNFISDAQSRKIL